MIFASLKEKIIFYNIPVIIFCLIPFFLITGPFLSDLSISLISLLYIVYCIKKKFFFYFNNRYFYFFLAFWVYLIINTLINNFNLDSLKISFFYIRYGIFVIAIVTLLNFKYNFIKYFFYCIFICFTILILDGFYEYFFSKNIFGWNNPETSRISSLFRDEYILGSYLSRLWPIFFGISIIYFKGKEKLFILFILIFILSETLIFLSGDRTSFFYINLSAVFVILFSQKLLKLRLITLLSSISLVIIISFVNPTAKERLIDKTLQQMNIVNVEYREQKGLYIFSKEHTHHYIAAYKMYLDNKILGVGVKNFRKVCKDEKYKISNLSCTSHPHNTYVQILSETGILGFIFLLTILIYFCIYVFKHLILKFKKKFYFTDFEICILSGIAIYLWPLIPTGNVFNNWLNIIMILNLPFLIWSREQKREPLNLTS